MVWIDYKKAYDIVLQTWMVDSVEIYKISNKVLNFITKTMENWRVELATEGKIKAEVKKPKSHLLGKLTFTIAICYSNNGSQLYT